MRRSFPRGAMAAALCVVLLAGGGCGGSTSRYDWGSYQPSVARLYSDQSPGALADDRQRLVAEVRKTESRGKLKVPPGKYAHIGYLCYLSGDRDAARTYFEAEGRSYPESAKLMNDMIGRLQ
jgi:hypothetical protein